MDKHVELKPAWDSIRVHLENERKRVAEEIRSYPTPIPRCDEQFNHLIERRERLAEALVRLDAAARSAAGASANASPVEAFIDSSDCFDDDARLRLKTALRQALVKPMPA
jgi:hypothetical protein